MSPDPRQRDWDKELADIDKVIAKATPGALVPGSGSATPPKASTRGGAPAVAPPTRRAALATWLRVGLGLLLAAGITQWPYFHACGTGLYLYLGAIGMTVVAGLWSTASSWRRRMGLAHSVSLLVVLWGGGVAASEILPRIGYAKRVAQWWCP